MIRRPPRSTLLSSSAASDVYKRQHSRTHTHSHTHTLTHAHTHIHSHTHACTHTHTHAHTHALTPQDVEGWENKCWTLVSSETTSGPVVGGTKCPATQTTYLPMQTCSVHQTSYPCRHVQQTQHPCRHTSVAAGQHGHHTCADVYIGEDEIRYSSTKKNGYLLV